MQFLATSYYKEDWGFCISQKQFDELKKELEVVIKSKLFNGQLNYGELLIKGKTNKEIFLKVYLHPSMANNELSGISVQTFISMVADIEKKIIAIE